VTESAPDPEPLPDPQQPPDPEHAPDPQEPPSPQQRPDPQPQYPQYPTGPDVSQPADNPRPIRTGRVWAGIGLAFLGHILAICVGIGISSTGGFGSYYGFAFPLVEFLVFAACLVVGILQLARGDRGIGVGLLVGWAAGAVILGGVCVALIVVVANAFGG
jgi:hypothetical protein